jgi:hypothetical protein
MIKTQTKSDRILSPLHRVHVSLTYRRNICRKHLISVFKSADFDADGILERRDAIGCFKKISGVPFAGNDLDELLAMSGFDKFSQTISCEDFVTIMSCVGAACKQNTTQSAIVTR